MYFGYNPHNQTHPHSMSLPSQSMSQGINALTFAKSLLLEPQVVTLQRESENYIRKVEQEKKHYYSVEETWVLVFKEWKERKDRMMEIQKVKQSPEQKLLHSQVKNLQNSLEQAISKYNETNSQNQELQRQINSLRKERVQFLNIHNYLQKELTEVSKETDHLEGVKDENQNQTQKSKEVIVQLKRKNDSEKMIYVEQFERLQKEVLDEKRQREANKIAARKEKIESIDTATLMKQRLKRIIANNKEKVNIIGHYLKNMKVIDEAFNQIKEASGITDIEEITNTFIKSEEQNYSLYNYVDILSQEIDNLVDQNEEMKKKIVIQEEENEVKMKLLKATPVNVRRKRNNERIIEKRQKEISDLRQTIDGISSDLQSILVDLGGTQLAPDRNKQFDYQHAFNLNEGSLELYLQDLEYYVNLLVAKQQMSLNESVVHNTLLLDQIPTKDFNTPRVGQPNIQQEDLQIDGNKLVDQKKLRQLAMETIEKKKKQ